MAAHVNVGDKPRRKVAMRIMIRYHSCDFPRGLRI
jgi:hypothetical protein